MDRCLRHRGRNPRRNLGRGADRTAGPHRLVGGDAGDRAEGAPAPRRAAAAHRPHGMWISAFTTDTPRGRLPVLELSHRRRARCENRIRDAKAPPYASPSSGRYPIWGLMKLPLQSFAQNRICTQIIQLAAYTQTIAVSGHDARRWEPKRPRTRFFEIPATLVIRSRAMVLRPAQHARSRRRRDRSEPTPHSRLPDLTRQLHPPLRPTSPSSREWNPGRPQQTLRRTVTPVCQNQAPRTGNNADHPCPQPR